MCVSVSLCVCEFKFFSGSDPPLIGESLDIILLCYQSAGSIDDTLKRYSFKRFGLSLKTRETGKETDKFSSKIEDTCYFYYYFFFINLKRNVNQRIRDLLNIFEFIIVSNKRNVLKFSERSIIIFPHLSLFTAIYIHCARKMYGASPLHTMCITMACIHCNLLL